jgi:hypothetical protein
MSQDVGTNITRRKALASLAAVAMTGGAIAGVVAASADPIFRAIETHRAATAAFGAALDRQNDLENAGISGPTFSGDLTDDDHPDWIIAIRAVWATSDAEDEAACAILDTPPTTLEGVAAILAYAAEYERKGDQWPRDLVHDDNVCHGRDWAFYLHQMLADAVGNIAKA